MVGDALSLKSRPVSASNGHWRGPFFAERRKGPLAAGHLPGNQPKTSGDRDPGGHMRGKSPARPARGGLRDLPRWPETEHMPLPGWKSTMCQSGPPFRGRIGDERITCALRSGHGAGPPRLEPELRPLSDGMWRIGGMRRASRGLGGGGRTRARDPKCAYVRFRARMRPFPALRLAHGPFLASPHRSRAGRAVPGPSRPGSDRR